jgi:hypothetical protein
MRRMPSHAEAVVEYGDADLAGVNTDTRFSLVRTWINEDV